METKICSRCGRELSIAHFKNTRWGHYTEICNECNAAKRKENKEKKKANIEKRIDDARNLRLADFTPREMMQELARRGYAGK